MSIAILSFYKFFALAGSVFGIPFACFFEKVPATEARFREKIVFHR